MRNAAYESLVSADASREEWLRARAGLVTASDVPVILGIVPGKPKLWYEKVGLLERAELTDSEVLQMGHDSEPFNAERYVAKTGRKVRRCQELLRSKQHPWLGATLDYWTWLPGEKRPGPLELKCTGNKDLWPEDGAPAPKFQAQLQTQMLVTGSAWGSLSALIGSPYLHHRWVDFERDDQGLCDLILTETRAFAESVQAGTNPPVDGDESTSDALRNLVVEVLAGTTVVLPDDAIEWDQELAAAKEAIKAWSERQRFYENVLMTAIGEHEIGELPNGERFTFKRQSRKAYTVAETSFRKLHRVAPKKPRPPMVAVGPSFADEAAP